jgi:DivIVA domain-containing protein
MEARSERPAQAPRTEIRTRVPDGEIARLRDVPFSTAMRGYDRDEVDRYVERVNQVLAELQITAAPESAVRRALEDVSQERESVIEDAHKAADEITGRSRSRADDRVQEAEAEAQKVRETAARNAHELREAAERDARQIREAAEARVRDLEAEARAMIDRRAGVIEELRELAGTLDDVVEAKGDDPAASPAPAQADGAG